MNNIDPKEFKRHLNKIIGYLDEITQNLEKALDTYLLVEKPKNKKRKKK